MSAPFSEFMCAALGTPDTSQPTEGAQPDFHKPGAFSGMSWDTLCPSCWEENLKTESAVRRASAPAVGYAPLPLQTHIVESCGHE
ncbi:hypothetical protein D3C87_1237950 [compost metagenome]